MAGESAAIRIPNAFTTKPLTMKYRVQELEISADEPFKNDALAREPLVRQVAEKIDLAAAIRD